MQITVQFYGAFRQYGDSVQLTLDSNGRVKDLREQLMVYLSEKHAAAFNSVLLDNSRFANETAVLEEDHILTNNNIVVILPPVSGG